MSKYVQAAQTSQALCLTALGLREAGNSIQDARHAVREQHDAQLASLGVRAEMPEPGRIVFHETDGCVLKQRAADLIGRASGKSRDGSASAVLQELVVEPSGLIADILQRLDTTSQEVLERLDQAVANVSTTPVPEPNTSKDRVSGAYETFVPAPIEQVWEFLADPGHVADWEVSVGSIENAEQEARPGMVWEGRAPQTRPDGKPVRIRPRFRRRQIELVAVEHAHRVAWRFIYPDAPQSRSILTEFAPAETTGGTQVIITTSWTRHTGWRRRAGIPLRPLQRFMVWLSQFQTGSAISRAFR